MQLTLPPHLSQARFDRALAAFARVVGDEWVLATDEDRATYLDVYAPGNEASHAPAAAIAPASVEEVQAIVRLANEHRVPLWPISRGKNLGYGGSAPRMPGTLILDLGRMKRILEVDTDLAYCVIEPGVGFFDMHEHLQANRIPLELGIPGNAWGSLLGNALERGFSIAGDHSENICGLEVVLPSGELVRTGMGALPGGRTGPLFKHGFGPSWDQMFVQSSFGVVTKMGLWLRPEPESTITLGYGLPKAGDLEWWVDTVTPLHLRGVLEGNVGVTSYMASATMRTQRSEWYTGRDSLPDEVIERIKQKYDAGWWNGTLRLTGYPEITEAKLRIVQQAFAGRGIEFDVRRFRRGEPGAARVPSVYPLQIVNWHGGRGGHLSFSPVLPATGRGVREQLERTRRRYVEHGIDYSATFYHGGRNVTNVNLMLYDRDDDDLTRRSRALFDALVKDSAAAGYGEYRTHLSYMDAVAGTFAFNDHALWRLHETVKDALDPNGVLAPGKSGIWPRVYRDRRGVV